MKALFVVGLVILVLGIVSFFVPVPHTEHHGIDAGDVHLGVNTHHDEMLPPYVGVGLIVVWSGPDGGRKQAEGLVFDDLRFTLASPNDSANDGVLVFEEGPSVMELRNRAVQNNCPAKQHRHFPVKITFSPGTRFSNETP